MEEAMKSKGGKSKGPAAGAAGGAGPKSHDALPPMQQPEMGKSVRIVDRMVNQVGDEAARSGSAPFFLFCQGTLD